MLLGIDVSHHQHPGAIDWRKLAATHRFAIARATYGTKVDSTCAVHLECARAAGLTVGLYHFFRPQLDAYEQMAAFERAATVFGMGDGWILPALDVERNEKYDGPFTAERYAEPCRQICEALAKLHGGAIVYTNPADWTALGSPAWIREHTLWIAHWNVAQPEPPFGMPWAIWQARVAALPGVYEKAIDQNVAHEPLPLIRPELDPYDDEEETTAVTRAVLHQAAAEVRDAVRELELTRDRDAETKARDQMVSDADSET